MAAHKPPRPTTTGFLVVDKPLGRSSMSAVAEVRRKAGGAKTGHAGTLDPLATGILVLALGRGTRSLETMMNTSKRYRTTVNLDAFSNCDDLEGELEPVDVPEPPSREAIEELLASMVGELQQRPPLFSAMMVNGVRAYKLARKGSDIELPARPVMLYDARLVEYAWPSVTVELHTGKGFYVRSFARNLGESLGTGGYCAALRRTAVGPFDESMATELADVPEGLTEEDLLDIAVAMQMVAEDLARMNEAQ